MNQRTEPSVPDPHPIDCHFDDPPSLVYSMLSQHKYGCLVWAGLSHSAIRSRELPTTSHREVAQLL